MTEEQQYCPFCGSTNQIDSSYCSNCGSELKQDTSLVQQQTQQPIHQQYPVQDYSYRQAVNTRPVYVYRPEKMQTPNEVTPKVIIGFIIGIISLFGFSWGIWFLPIRLWWIMLLTAIVTIVGLILSIISIKDHKVFGIIGIVFNAIAILPQGIALSIMIIFFVLFGYYF